jgi:hypothetical protein
MQHLLSLWACIFGIFSLSGCAKVQHLPQLLTLKSYSDHGEAADSFVNAANALFEKLKTDIIEQRLYPKTSASQILKTYGQPVHKELVERDGSQFEQWLYRHPTEAFKTDKVYLLFDSAGFLANWEVLPYQ